MRSDSWFHGGLSPEEALARVEVVRVIFIALLGRHLLAMRDHNGGRVFVLISHLLADIGYVGWRHLLSE